MHAHKNEHSTCSNLFAYCTSWRSKFKRFSSLYMPFPFPSILIKQNTTNIITKIVLICASCLILRFLPISINVESTLSINALKGFSVGLISSVFNFLFCNKIYKKEKMKTVIGLVTIENGRIFQQKKNRFQCNHRFNFRYWNLVTWKMRFNWTWNYLRRQQLQLTRNFCFYVKPVIRFQFQLLNLV